LPEPEFSGKPTALNLKAMADLGLEQPYQASTVTFIARDGTKLSANRYTNDSDTTILLLHGMLASKYTFNKMSGLLRESANAEVYALDFRGHGESGGRPGDIDYIGQYTDDVIDVINLIKKDKPNQKIILAGHSMGGGVALRFAMKDNHPNIDGYLLFAPSLGHSSPTAIKAPYLGSDDGVFLKVHSPRLIALYTLNLVGNKKYNSLPVIFFNVPKAMPIKEYSYRSNVSMAPENFTLGLKAVDKPLLIIVGTNDNIFIVEQFEPAVKGYSTGKVVLVEGATHNGIRHETLAMQAVSHWLNTNKLL